MIKVNGITKRYGDKIAVENLSFTINQGEIVGFLGPNGAGKSTTMNILTGFTAANEGQVTIGEFDLLEDPIFAKKQIGYLPEVPPLYRDMTVWAYLGFCYDLKKVKKPKKAHIDEVCEKVKIADVKGRLIKNLSKGYGQRVGLAQALIGDPPILILDEPTAGLDPKQMIDMRRLIKGLGGKHTILLSTHILSEVQDICDRILVLSKGKKVAFGTADELAGEFSGGKGILVRVEGNGKQAATLLRALAEVSGVKLVGEKEEGTADLLVTSRKEKDVRRAISKTLALAQIPVLAMGEEATSLEDIFLEATGTPEAKADNKGNQKNLAEKDGTEKTSPTTKKAKGRKTDK